MRGFVWPLVIRLSGVPDAPYFIWFLLPTGGMLSLVCLCLLTQLSRLNPFSLKPTIGSLQCPSVSLHCRSLLNPASQAFHHGSYLSVSFSTPQWLRWARNTLLSNYPIWTH